ncbi:hypothetical protein GCM10009601_44150 [Streptomyces thermospinosisporus]|uniref:Uncharacterized protein n=1 Tax=Streptomyces thermospinosisporus TaxID=161482 RepID=A0ABN1Z382_9ACTN
MDTDPTERRRLRPNPLPHRHTPDRPAADNSRTVTTEHVADHGQPNDPYRQCPGTRPAAPLARCHLHDGGRAFTLSRLHGRRRGPRRAGPQGCPAPRVALRALDYQPDAPQLPDVARSRLSREEGRGAYEGRAAQSHCRS